MSQISPNSKFVEAEVVGSFLHVVTPVRGTAGKPPTESDLPFYKSKCLELCQPQQEVCKMTGN